MGLTISRWVKHLLDGFDPGARLFFLAGSQFRRPPGADWSRLELNCSKPRDKSRSDEDTSNKSNRDEQICESTLRPAEDRLPCCRSESIAASRSDNVMRRPRAAGNWLAGCEN